MLCCSLLLCWGQALWCPCRYQYYSYSQVWWDMLGGQSSQNTGQNKKRCEAPCKSSDWLWSRSGCSHQLMKCQLMEEYSSWGTCDWQDDMWVYDWMWHWLEQEDRCWDSLRSKTSVYPLCWSFHPIDKQKREDKENENEAGRCAMFLSNIRFDFFLPATKLNVDLLWPAWQEIKQDSCPSK